jgi:hypothetical protein
MSAPHADQRQWRRHEARRLATVIRTSAQRLRRQLAQTENLRAADRTRLDDELAELLAAADALRDRIAALTEESSRDQAPSALARWTRAVDDHLRTRLRAYRNRAR